MNTSTRRHFIKQTALTGVAAFAAPAFVRATGVNDTLNVAAVGLSCQGYANRFNLENRYKKPNNLPTDLPKVRINVTCDTDRKHGPMYQDYRKMLDEKHREIDAVVVSTPDHMHAPITLAAMDLDKHVYCEKPLTWSIDEARLVAEAAKSKSLATQMGTQGMSHPNMQKGIDFLQSGVLGDVTELHVWSDRAGRWWPHGIRLPSEAQPVPGNLDWNSWLGVAADRPYRDAYQPFLWRGYKDFGTGAIGDMGIHITTMPYLGLKLTMPTSVDIVGVSELANGASSELTKLDLTFPSRRTVEYYDTSGFDGPTYPKWTILKLTFPATEITKKPVSMYWYDGGQRPSADLIDGDDLGPNGAIVVGSEGTFHAMGECNDGFRTYPDGKFEGGSVPRWGRAGADLLNLKHRMDWARACMEGGETCCAFDKHAAKLTECMLIGALALKIGKGFKWNAEEMIAEGCPEAERYITRERRDY